MREYCCDELACEVNDQNRERSNLRYAQALLHVVELKRGKVRSSEITSLAASGRSPSELRRRVARLFGEPIREPLRLSRGGMFALTALLLFSFFGPISLLSRTEIQANAQVVSDEATDGSLPTIDVLLQKIAGYERAYHPYQIKSVDTFRMGKDLTQDQLDSFPWGDGRKHQKLMDYAQHQSGKWLRKEGMLKDDQFSQQLDMYFDGNRLLQVRQLLNPKQRPKVYDSGTPEWIGKIPFTEPLYGIFPLSVFSNGSLLSAAIEQDRTKVSLAWDGKDARLTFSFGEEGAKTRFILWLSSKYDWHPYKLQRFDRISKRLFSEWEVETFAQQQNQWRIESGTHRYRVQDESRIPAKKMTYAIDFKVLEAKYDNDVSEKIFQYVVPSNGETKDSVSDAADPLDQFSDGAESRSATQAKTFGGRFLALPVTTDLQRSLLGSVDEPDDQVSLCVIVSADAFEPLGEINEQIPGYTELLGKMKQHAEKDSRRVRIHIWDGMKLTRERRQERMDALVEYAEQIGKQAGFEDVRVSRTVGVNWSKSILRARIQMSKTIKGNEQASVAGDVGLYPVETFLSHLLVNSNYVANYLSLVRDKERVRFRQNVLPAVAEAVKKLGSVNNENLLIRLRYSKTAYKEIDDWIVQQGPSAFAKQLGLNECFVSLAMIAESEERSNKKYTHPITVSGQALDEEGEPIAGATIHLVDRKGSYELLAKVITDATGKYRFEQVSLPIERAETNHRIDSGAFEIFGIADNHALAWRPKKWFYPDIKVFALDTDQLRLAGEKKTGYGAEEPIVLNLMFRPPTSLRGRIVDDLGEPIANTQLAIKYCDVDWNRSDYSTMSSRGSLDCLNGPAVLPTQVQNRKTDSHGRFEFTGLPADYRWQVLIRPPGHSPRQIWAVTHDHEKFEREGTRIYSGDFEVVFPRPRTVKFRVVYEDTAKPASKVGIGATVSQAAFWKTTDEKGLVEVPLADGTYNISVSPCYGTTYLSTSKQIVISEESDNEPINIQLRAAAIAEITVVDADTGKPLKDVDVWHEQNNSQGRTFHKVRGYRSWEVETSISHFERPRTNDKGIMRVLFEPGKQRIGVGKEFSPKGYAPVEAEGKELELKLGELVQVQFQLRNMEAAKADAQLR